MTLETVQGRKHALEMLARRRANQPVRVDNSAFPAGSPMTYYCISCGSVSDVLPETHMFPPRKLCRECAALKELGWLE